MQPICIPPSSLVGSQPFPAFYAQRSSPLTFSGKLVVSYDQVTTNLADGFNGKTGIFSAPVRGLYYFFFSASYCQINAYIVKNGKSKISSALVMHSITKSNTNCSFPTHAQATLQLDVGDQISVKVQDSSSFLRTSNVHRMNQTMTFTGFLLSSLDKVDIFFGILIN